MSDRNRTGDLTVDALRTGKVDQFAHMVNGRTIAATIGAYPAAPTRPFFVQLTVTRKGLVEESHLTTYTSIDEARKRFRHLRNNHR